MRHMLTSMFCWNFYCCIGCSNQSPPIPSPHTSNADPVPTAKTSEDVRSETESYLSKESRELFAWYDTLGFPDLNKRKYVRFSEGFIFHHHLSNSPRDTLSYSPHVFHGFLIETFDQEFELFTLGLRTKIASKTKPDSITKKKPSI